MSKEKETDEIVWEDDFEEGHFYHTITAFEDLVDEYGFEKIIDNISDDLYIAMFDFFVPVEQDE